MLRQVCQFAGAGLWLLIWGLVAAPAGGQNLLSPRDPFYQLGAAEIEDLPHQAEMQLARVDQLVASGDWDEAVETLRGVAEKHGTRLKRAAGGEDGAGGSLFYNVQTYCQQRLARLPDPARALYRARVDAVAEKWYADGIQGRDVLLLQRIVDQLFCSSRGDDALLALGDIALEKGHPHTARWHWERISPLTRAWDGRAAWYLLAGLEAERWGESIEPQLRQPAEKIRWPAYPDTDLNLAAVRARLVLASILADEPERAELELRLLQRLHPDESGYLAGTEGNYVQNLTQLLAASRGWPPLQADRDWSTFAGAPDRARRRPQPLELWGKPSWEIRYADVQLTSTAAEHRSRPRRGESDLAFYPLIVDNLVLINNSHQIFAFDAATGQPAFGTGMGGQFYPAHPVRQQHHAVARRGVLSEPRHTLTVFDHNLYARIGSPATMHPRPGTRRLPPNALVCLDLRRQGGLKWQHPAHGEEARFAGWAFEGPPVADEEGVYVCLRRTDAQPEAHVAALDPATGRLRWRRRICAANFPTAGRQNQFSHTMLTLTEGTLYVNTNLGAIAALRTGDGLIQWVYRYPRTELIDLNRPPEHFYRDLNPCLFHQGLVIAAPRDGQQILALDAGSGQLVWRSIPLAAHPRHLLGVGNGNLIATGKSIWWLNVVTGRAEYVWPHPDNHESERGYGRGVLAGDEIYWPTHEKILVFDQRIRRQGTIRSAQQVGEFVLAAPPINARGGNLVVNGDTLLIAAADTLYGFHHPSAPPAATAEPPATSHPLP